MGSFHAWWSLATILGALCAAVAASTPLSLLQFFAMVAAALLVVQLAAGPRYLRSPSANQAVPDPLARVVPWRPLVVFGVAVVGAFVIDSSVSNWSALDLTTVLGASESVAALAYAAYAACTLAGRSLTDRVVTRRGPSVLIRGGSFITAVGLAGVALAPSPWLAIAAFGVVGLGLSPILPLAFVAAARHDPLHTGVAVARVNVGNYIGFVIGAPLVGVIGEYSSLRIGFAALILVALALTLTAPAFEE